MARICGPVISANGQPSNRSTIVEIIGNHQLGRKQRFMSLGAGTAVKITTE